jgi:hypothetical protein
MPVANAARTDRQLSLAENETLSVLAVFAKSKASLFWMIIMSREKQIVE